MVAMEITLLVLSPTIQVLCALTLIYSCLSTIRQADIKIIIAYSSVGHIALSLIGLLSNTIQGITGGFLLALAHGFTSPFLFFLIGGVLYDRFGTRLINYYRGLSITIPLFSLFLFIACLGNIGTPLTFNFVGEFLCLLGTFSLSFFSGFIMALGIVLSASYSIYLYTRITSGTSSIHLPYHSDLNKREFFICSLFLIFIIVLGVYPSFILNDIEFDISNLILDIPLPISPLSSSFYTEVTVFCIVFLFIALFIVLCYSDKEIISNNNTRTVRTSIKPDNFPHLRFVKRGIHTLPKLIPTLNPWWVSGMCDGESSFIVSLIKSSSHRLGWQVQYSFLIELHIRDKELLEQFKAFFGGIGVVSIRNTRNACVFSVSSLEQIFNFIIPHALRGQVSLNYPKDSWLYFI